MKTINEKLQKLIDNNPDFAPIIIKEFPHLSAKPFIYSNTLFIRDKNFYNLYSLNCKHDFFYIKNVTTDKPWAGKIRKSGWDFDAIGGKRDNYLTLGDFLALLKQSAIKLDRLTFITEKDIKDFHLLLTKEHTI